jgi:hypothetical protein
LSGTIDFTGTTLVTEPLVTGEIVATGTADFADDITATGVDGTALLIDAGGIGIFEAASEVTLGSNVTIGDAGGAGTIEVMTSDFQIGTAGSSANLVIASNALAAGSVAEITGAVAVTGDLLLGQSAAATLDLSGDLTASATTIDASGTLNASGSASASFGGLVDAGTLVLENEAEANATNLILTGVLQLGGQSGLTGLSSAVIGGTGSLSIGQEASLSAGELNQIGGNMSIAGMLEVAGNLVSEATITLSGGTLSAAAATLSSGGLLSGFGEVMLSGGTIAAPGGDIVATGGTLVLDGNVSMSNGGSIAIAAGATLDLIAGAAGNVAFSGINSELIINDLGSDSASVSGMVGHDVIDLVGVAPSLVTFSGGVISAENAGNPIGSFALSVASGQPAVEIVSDGHAGALITLGGEMACFAQGTRLLTPNGYKPVESFIPGDPIITQGGLKKPVRWIGRRVMETGLRAPSDVRPVVVMAGALGQGVPSRAIRLSPSHAVFMDGVLVPVMHLVNGATILRDRKAGMVTYYHLELDRHEVVMADGMLLETYLDTGNRGQFEQETGERGNARQSCAKLVTRGPELRRIRRRLHELAIQAGFTTTREPELRLLARDLTLLPEILPARGRTLARFTLPPDAGRIMLVARSAAPADTDPDSDDRRELGICLRQPRPKNWQLRLGAGWYQKAAGDAGIWMSGSGEVLVPPGTPELTLHLAAVAQSWRAPRAIDLTQPGF